MSDREEQEENNNDIEDNDDNNNNNNNNNNDNNNNDNNNNKNNITEPPEPPELAQLELKEDDDDGIVGVNIDDTDIKSIPSIASLREREDVTITELLGYIDRYQGKMEIMAVKTVKLRESKRENVKKHRGSVIDLHNRMFKKLIETESEQKTELERTHDRVKELEVEIKKYDIKQQEEDAANKGDAENFKSSQLQQFIDTNAALEKRLDSTKKEMKDVKAELNVEKMKHDRAADSHRKSISTLHTNMFKKLLDAEDDFEDKIDRLQDEVSTKSRALQMEKLKNEQSDKLRRDSIQTVHNNMLTKLLDAQAEHDEKEEKYQNEIKELKNQLRKEILKNSAKADKAAERAQNNNNNIDIRSPDGDDSDMSDLETANETRKSTVNDKDNNRKQQFDDLWDEADEPEAEINRLKAHIDKIERELKEEKEKNVFIEKQRKDSIHNLHNNMFQKLLDAEFEYEEEIERLHREKEELMEKIKFYEDAFEKMNRDETKQQKQIINPTQVIELKEEIKQKNEIIDDNKQRIFHLTEKIEKLEVQIQNEQKQRRGSISFLSKQMMAKLLEAEEENEETKKKFKDKLMRLQKELEESKEMSFNLEKTRRNSVTKVSQTMFHKLLQAEQTKKQMIQQYEDRIQELEKKLAVERLKNETVTSKEEMNSLEISRYKTKAQQLESQVIEIKKESENKERKRRESFTVLQNSYWKKLLEAEDDYEVQIKKLKHEIIRLQQEINIHKRNIEWLTTSKCNLIIECNKQMNDLRKAVIIYNNNQSQSSSWFR